MRWERSLDEVFGGRSHVKVLRALYRLPEDYGVSGRELARRAGLTHPTAIKTAEALADAGLVRVGRGPAGEAYEFNREHYMTTHVSELFEAEARARAELESLLRDELLMQTDKVLSAALFGSVVAGASTPGSDIDLAVICTSADVREVESVLDELSDLVYRRFGNRLNVVVSTRAQARRRGIWRRLEEEGVEIIPRKEVAAN
jgi:predicted nucleotidyltransferase